MSQMQDNETGRRPSPPWGPEEELACLRLVELALAEDLDRRGDLTSNTLLASNLMGAAAFVARSRGVVAGLPAVRTTFGIVDPAAAIDWMVSDGEQVDKGATLGMIHGRMCTILTGERTALNFIQHLSGVATQTGRFVDAIAGLSCTILDTRKTTPGWRRLEKYAVRCGGGHNHRLGLYDAILIKDNHLAVLARNPDPIGEAVGAARLALGASVPIEVEVASLEQLERALEMTPNRILLDNMDLDTLRAAVRMRNDSTPRIPLEATGGVTLATVRAIAETGVDFISIGALTHSAPALDIALDYR